MIHIIDLHFYHEHTIASFVIPSSEGPIVVETGPHSTYPQLVKGLSDLGYQPSDVRHVLLSHIHFDHAGAAWALAEAGATVYVHPVGAPHMASPERLYNSAKRIYGDKMEELWGKMQPIAGDRLKVVGHQEVLEIGGHRFVAHHTPGHASHHIAWQLGDAIFTGDVAGCKIENGPVVPPCPPPDIDIEAWKESISLLKTLSPKTLYLTHFGPIEAIDQHLGELEQMLDGWADWIKRQMTKGLDAQTMTPLFQAYTDQQLRDAGLRDDTIAQYEAANPAWMSVAGLMRYWKKREA